MKRSKDVTVKAQVAQCVTQHALPTIAGPTGTSATPTLKEKAKAKATSTAGSKPVTCTSKSTTKVKSSKKSTVSTISVTNQLPKIASSTHTLETNLTDTKNVGDNVRTSSLEELAEKRLRLPAGVVGECGTVKVRFNHYNKSFPIFNGVLKFADIDEEYCLSFAYKGNFLRTLVLLNSQVSTVTEKNVHSSTCDSSEQLVQVPLPVPVAVPVSATLLEQHSANAQTGTQEAKTEQVGESVEYDTDEQGRVLFPHDAQHKYFLYLRDQDECRMEVAEDPLLANSHSFLHAGGGGEDVEEGESGLRSYNGALNAAALQSLSESQSQSRNGYIGAKQGEHNKHKNNTLQSTSRGMDQITAELKAMDPSQLSNSHARLLIEQRDLEDILYSNA
jgi:hypothetical protein